MKSGNRQLRVVSLLPSSTDIVCALGLRDLLVARSHECDDASVHSLPVITESKLEGCDLTSREIDAAAGSLNSALGMGAPTFLLLEWGLGVYRTDLSRLQELKPDVILTQVQASSDFCGGASLPRPTSEVPADVQYQQALQDALGFRCQVVHSDPQTVEESWADIETIANAIGAHEAGKKLLDSLHKRVETATSAAAGRACKKVACIQWADPLYAGGAWVPELIRLAGGEDVLGGQGGGGPAEERLQAARPHVVLFALCGMDLSDSVQEAGPLLRRWAQLKLEQCSAAVCDARRLFSRPGPAIVESLELLVNLLHPETHPYTHVTDSALRILGPLDGLTTGPGSA